MGKDQACNVCGEKCKFLNLSKGYTKTCSQSCAIKTQWFDNEDRKQQLSERFSKNNPSTGRPKGTKNKNQYPKSKLVLERIKNAKLKDWTGLKHTEDTKKKMSVTRLEKIASGEITIMASYKGKFQPRHPEKYKGDPAKIIYRSRWELMCMSKFDSHPDVLEWSSEEIRIPYRSPIERKIRTYFPDFWVKKKDRSGNIVCEIIEVKPFSQTKPPTVMEGKVTKRYLNEVMTWGVNSSKWKAATEYCKDRNWNFVIITEKELGLKF